MVARRQLAELGLSSKAIEHRVGAGRLHVLHRGVYAVGHTVVSQTGRWLAGTLISANAVLSRRSAGALWQILRWEGVVEVAVPAALRPRTGLRIFTNPLRDDEHTVEDGIPVTTPARTLLDLAAVLSRPRLEIAIDRAEHLRLGSPTSLAELLDRHPRRRGTAALRAILGEHGVLAQVTRFEMEDAFYAFVAERGLPQPRTNWGIGAYELDAAWPDHRLGVELDSRAHHLGLHAFEHDRAKDRSLAVAGWRVIRVTWRHLTLEPDTLASDLHTLLRDRVRR